MTACQSYITDLERFAFGHNSCFREKCVDFISLTRGSGEYFLKILFSRLLVRVGVCLFLFFFILSLLVFTQFEER